MRVAFLMDAIEIVKPAKDTSLALAYACQQQGWEIYYVNSQDIFFDEQVMLQVTELTIDYTQNPVYHLGQKQAYPAKQFDSIVLRSAPPFDNNYLYRTQLLSIVAEEGVSVINSPSAVRDFNEKLFILKFTQYTPDILVSSDIQRLKGFLQQQNKIVLKPLNSMGGDSIFVLQQGDMNTNVILEIMTQNQARPIMAQSYLREIAEGDKRVLLINGKPSEYCLARIPVQGESRGNLAAGGTGQVQKTSQSNLKIAQEVGSYCKSKGLVFVGLDIIGEAVTEINVTSPTCLKEIDAHMQGALSQQFIKGMTSNWNA